MRQHMGVGRGPQFLMCVILSIYIVYLFVFNRVEYDYYKYHPMAEVRKPDNR